MKLATVTGSKGIAILSGLFVLLGFFALAGWLYFQVVKPGQRAHYYIFMNDVTGIRPGTEVKVAGYPIGQVDAITPDLDLDQIEFQVDIVIDKIWPISIDSTISIVNDGLLSTPILDLTPGRTKTLLAEGARILTIAPPPSITQQISGILEKQVAPTLAAFLKTIEQLQGRIEEDVPAIMTDARSIMSSTAKSMSALENEIDKLAQGMGAAGSLMSRLGRDQTAEQVEALLAKLQDTADNIKATSKRLDSLMQKSNALVDSGTAMIDENRPALRSTVADAEFALQSVATSITFILQNLERASQEIASLTGRIQADPKVIVTGEPERRGPFQ
ncbi:MAG TPA: MlaD family protein [Kiloniellaceae bacterium]|nr:MlaD family protein [Kiloniellaceae bacterium]